MSAVAFFKSSKHFFYFFELLKKAIAEISSNRSFFFLGVLTIPKGIRSVKNLLVHKQAHTGGKLHFILFCLSEKLKKKKFNHFRCYINFIISHSFTAKYKHLKSLKKATDINLKIWFIQIWESSTRNVNN